VACLHGQRLVFIGDAKMKELFLFFASFADEPHAVKEDSVSHSLLLPLIWLHITE